MSYPFESLLEVDENMTEVWLMLQVFPTVLRLSIICGTASCSECYSICFSALISSCGLSLLRMSFNVTLVGRLMRLIFFGSSATAEGLLENFYDQWKCPWCELYFIAEHQYSTPMEQSLLVGSSSVGTLSVPGDLCSLRDCNNFSLKIGRGSSDAV